MKKIYLFAVLFVSLASNAQIVISQVYGGGGNSGATFTHDFIELFNRGQVPVTMTGWSVQYASATGPTAPGAWTTTQLPTVTIAPGKYYLIQQATNTTAGAALPTPDFNGICATCTTDGANGSFILTGIAMSGSNGKVILVNTTTPQTSLNPTGPQIIDKVGYGTTPTGFEGTGPTGTALTSTTAAIRNNGGCTDTENNPTDFTAAVPTPRNSATLAAICALSVSNNEIAGLKIYPNPVKGGLLYIDTQNQSEKNISIFDVLGKQVINVATASNSVNVSNLKDGVYFVKINEGGKTATRKLVINN